MTDTVLEIVARLRALPQGWRVGQVVAAPGFTGATQSRGLEHVSSFGLYVSVIFLSR